MGAAATAFSLGWICDCWTI